MAQSPIGTFLKQIEKEQNKLVQNIKKTIFGLAVDVRSQTMRNIRDRLNKSGTSTGNLLNSTSVELENGEPIVTVGGSAVPYAAAHEFGATIIPRDVKWLTIPNGRENAGKKAREYNNLTFRLINPQLGALIDKNSKQVIFWLKKQVKIKKKSYLTDAAETVMNKDKEKLEAIFGRATVWEITK